jgi:hypothetical protein
MSEYIPNYGDFETTISSMRVRKYTNRAASRTLRMISSTTGMIVEGGILQSMRDQGFYLDPTINNKSVYQPDSLWSALAKYDKKRTFTPNRVHLDKALRLTFKAFAKGSSYLVPLEDADELLSSLKREKASGAPYFDSKINSFEADLRLSERIKQHVSAPPPCVAYHRVQHGASGPKVRLVWGYPSSMTILEARFARPLIEYFKVQRSVMAFALWKAEIAGRLVPIENSGVRYGLDFSGFDNSIRAELIDQAFRILKSHFRDTEDNRVVWDRIIHYFIHTPILMPDGFIYKKHQGVPSGSYFTQLIDSIVNYIALQYMSLSVMGEPIEQSKVLVLGDDSVFGTRTHVPLVRISSCLKELGLTINTQKSLVLTGRESCEFLGHTWRRGFMDREAIDTAMRMAFPETVSDKLEPRLRVITRVLAMIGDSLTAWTVIREWTHRYNNDVRSYFMRDIDSESAYTGFSEITQQERRSTRVVDALDLASIGIMR